MLKCSYRLNYIFLMRKKIILILIVILVITGLYLFLSFKYIYYKIGKTKLSPTDTQQTYLITGGKSSSTKNIVYAAIGDSLTSGVGTAKYEESYPYLIAQKMAQSGENVTLQDFSYPGFRSIDVINALLKPVIDAQPDIVTLLIGTNDIHGRVWQSDFVKNYDYILKILTSKTKAKIYAVNIPFIGANSLIAPPYRSYFNWRTTSFNREIKKLTEKYQIKYIDLYTPTASELRRAGPNYSADLFHPSPKGYQDWARIIYASLNQ
jgi:lysophospholipase L1-like esterase